MVRWDHHELQAMVAHGAPFVLPMYSEEQQRIN
jgi:hypothetical protein